MRRMKYNWLLFDADGTLFDFDKVEEAALRSTFEALGCVCDERCTELYRQIDRKIWLDFENGGISQERLRTRRFELLLDAIGLDGDPGEFSRRYLAYLACGTDLIDGAEDLLRSLHGRVGLLLITNGLADVQRPRFARSVVRRYFSDVVISEEVGAGKPDPKIFDVAFARMGLPKKGEVLMVGDSLTADIKGGNDYGIDTCWFNPQGKPSSDGLVIHYEIGALQELLPLLEGA
jgi:2-haloacid dehalogenase